MGGKTYTDWDLEVFDSMRMLSYEEKVEIAHWITKRALKRFKRCCVACSFGKDSVAVMHIVIQHNPDIPIMFADTGVEMPEHYEYIKMMHKKYDLNLYIVKGKIDFWTIVKRYGLPTPRMMTKDKQFLVERGVARTESRPMCAKLLKDEPALKFYRKKGIRCVFFGIHWDDSYTRKWTIIRKGLLSYHETHKHWKCYPIGYFTKEEVFRYLKENDVPISPVYEKYGRSGCIPCTAYNGWREWMSKYFPDVYKKIMEIIGTEGTLLEFGVE